MNSFRNKCLLALSLMLLCSQANALGIIYSIYGSVTVTGVGNSYDVDIDRNGHPDFRVQIETPGGSIKYVSVLALDAYGGIETNGSYNALIYLEGDALPAVTTFQNYGYLATDPGDYRFDNRGVAYVHVQYAIAGMYVQGWIKIQVPTDANSFTIYSSAVCDNDVISIVAGQNVYVSVNEIPAEELSIMHLGKKLNINSKGNLLMNLYDSGGKLLKQEFLQTGQSLIELQDYSTGVYLLRIIDSSTGKQRFRKLLLY